MKNVTIKKEFSKFKKEFSHLLQNVKNAQDNMKYTNTYFRKYLKHDYEELKVVTRNNLEQMSILYEDERLSLQDKKKLSELLEAWIYHYRGIISKDDEYELFLKELAIRVGISLEVKDMKGYIGLLEDFFSKLSAVMQEGEDDDITSEKCFKQLLNDDYFQECEFSNEEIQLVKEQIEKEVSTDTGILFKYRFWSQFIELKHSANRVLEMNGNLIFSAKEKKKYERVLEKNYLSCNYIELLNIYMQIVEKQIEYCSRNIKKSSPDVEFPDIIEAYPHVMLLNFYDSPEIPGRLTAFVMHFEREQIKEILKKERKGIKSEIMPSMMLKYGLDNPDWIIELTSTLEYNEENIFVRTLFTLDSIFKTIS